MTSIITIIIIIIINVITIVIIKVLYYIIVINYTSIIYKLKDGTRSLLKVNPILSTIFTPKFN